MAVTLIAASVVLTVSLRLTFWPAVRVTVLLGAFNAVRPSIWPLTLMSVPAMIVSGDVVPVFAIDCAISTLVAAPIVIAPPVPAMLPLTATDPPLEATLMVPPRSEPVVTFPSAFRAIAPLPAKSPAFASMFAEPLVALAVIAAFLVMTAALTFRLFPAVSVAAPLTGATAALPSICAFTLMLLPAVALNAAPEVRLVTAWLTLTSAAAVRSTRPVVLPMTPLTLTDPPEDDAENDPPLIPPTVTSPPVLIVIAAVPDASVAVGDMVAARVAVTAMAPLFVMTALLMATSRDATQRHGAAGHAVAPVDLAVDQDVAAGRDRQRKPAAGLRIAWLIWTSWPASA
jgi:hypothetical protein